MSGVPSAQPRRRRRRQRWVKGGVAVVLGAVAAAAGLGIAAGLGTAVSAHRPPPTRVTGVVGGSRSAATPVSSGVGASTPTTVPTTVPTTTTAARVTTTTTAPAPMTEPGGGRTLLPTDRIVAYYGVAGVPALGVLGEAPPGALWPRLAAQAARYEQFGRPVVPAYELIAFVAQASPGADGSFTARIPDATISSYLDVVHAHHGLLILDIQPGRSSFLDDAQTLAPWLARPDVALGLDPEWELQPGQVPLHQIGQTSAGEINQVSAWLQDLVRAQHLPQKLLLVHQFTVDMVRDKVAVRLQPDLATVFNMDGFGGRAAKMSEYQALAADTRFGLGFKVFFGRDVGPFSPGELLALTPPLSVVEYE